MKTFVFTALLVMPVIAFAQSSLPSAVPLNEEDIAPPVLAVQPSATTPATPSATAPMANPMNVQTTVVMAGSTGYERDKALEAAARKALPDVLGRLSTPLGPEKAAEATAKLGDPMVFVKSYSIVKETLVPNYTLTVAFIFNQEMLEKNFGKSTTTTTRTVEVTSGDTGAVNAVDVAPASLANTYLLRMERATPSEQNRLLKAARSLPGSKAFYATLSTESTIIRLQTNLADAALQQALSQAGVKAGAPYGTVDGTVVDVAF